MILVNIFNVKKEKHLIGCAEILSLSQIALFALDGVLKGS